MAKLLLRGEGRKVIGLLVKARQCRRTFAANRVKRFYRRDQTLFPLDPDPEPDSSDSDAVSGSGDDYEPNDEEGEGYSEPLAKPKPSVVPPSCYSSALRGTKGPLAISETSSGLSFVRT